MAAEEIKDQSDELMGAFKDKLDQWMNPKDFPAVKWQEVLDARNACISHQFELVKTGQFHARAKRQGETARPEPTLPV